MTRIAVALRIATVVAALTTAAVASAAAQSATGAIEGVVVDPSGAVLPGSTVTLRQPATGHTRTTVSDAMGVFRAPLLPVGLYEVAAVLAGFETSSQPGFALTVGETVTLRIEMRVAGLKETVSVSGAPPVIERSRTGASATIDEAAIRNLPVNGRNFLEFVLLTPGVTRDVRAGDLSFAGQRGTLNSLLVDGADNNNTFFGQTLGRTGSGRAPYQFSLDTVQEFQVNAHAYSAEYGRAGGAVVNAVTRSGTNDLRGSLFDYYRDKALNATSAINRLDGRPKSPYHYHQFGGTLGGPLRRNRDFFFASYEGQRNRSSNDVFLNLPPSPPDDPDTRAAIARLADKAFNWPRTFDQDVHFARTDHQLTAGQRLTLRYNHQDFTGEGLEYTGQAGAHNAWEHTGRSLVRTRTLNALWTGVLRPTLFNELRLQYGRDAAIGESNTSEPEAIVREKGVGTVLTIGRLPFSPRETVIRRVQLADTLTWVRGPHLLKAGLDLQFDAIENFFPGLFSGSYTFDSLADFHLGQAAMYQQSFAGPGTTGPRSRQDVRDYSGFVMHEWRPRPGVTLNGGLRYDLMTIRAPAARNPDPDLAAAGIDTRRFRRDTDNWGPRVGVAWSPPERRFVVRGGAGLFYGRTPAILVNAAQINNGVNVVSLTFTGTQVPRYPEVFTGIPEHGQRPDPSIFYIAHGFASPRLLQASAGWEWSPWRHTALNVTALFVDGSDLPRSVDRNLGSIGTRTLTVQDTDETVDVPFFRSDDRPFRSFRRVIALESTAESRYGGITVEIRRRFAGAVHFGAAYTLGKVVDTVPDATALLPGVPGEDAKYTSNPLDYEVDRTVGNNDQRHRFVARGVVTSAGPASRLSGVPRAMLDGWLIGAIVTAQSGKPYSARVVGDLNGDGNASNDLAPGTRRNMLRLPALAAVDVRVAREIRLGGRVRTELIGEAFNLLNRDNVSLVLPTRYQLAGTRLLPIASFQRPIGTSGERIIQLAARVTLTMGGRD
jgi:hypothetical protein